MLAQADGGAAYIGVNGDSHGSAIIALRPVQLDRQLRCLQWSYGVPIGIIPAKILYGRPVRMMPAQIPYGGPVGMMPAKIPCGGASRDDGCQDNMVVQ